MCYEKRLLNSRPLKTEFKELVSKILIFALGRGHLCVQNV